jgi:uncharacterized protein YPO0396
MDDRIDAGTQRLIQNLEKRLDAVTERLDQAEDDLAECKRLHAASDAEVMRLKATLQGYGDARQMLQIDRSTEHKAENGR